MPDSQESQDLFATMSRIRRLRKAQPETSPNPVDVAEVRTRRRGTRLLIVGIVTCMIAESVTLRLIIMNPTMMLQEPARFAFTLLNLFALFALGAGLLFLGLAEKLGQPGRAAVRQTARIAPENAVRLEKAESRMAAMERLLSQVLVETQANGRLARELSKDGLDVLKQHGERIAGLEKVVERVPLYSEAVLDGIDLGRGVGGGNEGRF